MFKKCKCCQLRWCVVATVGRPFLSRVQITWWKITKAFWYVGHPFSW